MANADAGHQADLTARRLKTGAEIEILDMQEEAAVEAAQRPIIFSRQEHGGSADGRHSRDSGRQIARHLDSWPARDQTMDMQGFAQQAGRRRQVTARCPLLAAVVVDHDGAQQGGGFAPPEFRAKLLRCVGRQHAIRIQQQHVILLAMPHRQITARGKSDVSLPDDDLEARLDGRATREFRPDLARIAVIDQDHPLDRRVRQRGIDRREQDRPGAIAHHGDGDAAVTLRPRQMLVRRSQSDDGPAPRHGKGRPAERRQDAAPAPALN